MGERTDEEELPVDAGDQTASDDTVEGSETETRTDERPRHTADRTAERFLELESELAALEDERDELVERRDRAKELRETPPTRTRAWTLQRRFSKMSILHP